MNPPSVSRPAAPLPLVAIVAGPTATILNQDPPVTGRACRERHGLPPALDWFGRPVLREPLFYQRLAAPVTVYIEARSAHPLEADAKSQFAPPDGYLDEAGRFSPDRTSPTDRPVYEVTLKPEDGLFPLPYMARRADGSAWERHSPACGPDGRPRQTFWPDARRLIEEIERTAGHLNGNLSARARFSFHRAAPSAGLAPEKAGVDFFPYGYCEHFPPRPVLAEITRCVHAALAEPGVRGVVWLEGSPRIAETLYWLQLLIDTDRPIVGAAAQRPNHRLGADGPQQLVDAVDLILANTWADHDGRNLAGAMLVSDGRVFAAREAAKVAGRPGGFAALGGHGGILGPVSGIPLNRPLARCHGQSSAVRLSTLPSHVRGFSSPVAIKDAEGHLRGDAIPEVEIVALPEWMTDTGVDQIHGAAQRVRAAAPLGGLVAEGVTGGHLGTSYADALDRAALAGIPIVKVGRDAPEFHHGSPRNRLWVGGSNLTAAKARVLLMACLLRFGTCPSAIDPLRPTPEEYAAVRSHLAVFQTVFDTH